MKMNMFGDRVARPVNSVASIALHCICICIERDKWMWCGLMDTCLLAYLSKVYSVSMVWAARGGGGGGGVEVWAWRSLGSAGV